MRLLSIFSSFFSFPKPASCSSVFMATPIRSLCFLSARIGDQCLCETGAGAKPVPLRMVIVQTPPLCPAACRTGFMFGGPTLEMAYDRMRTAMAAGAAANADFDSLIDLIQSTVATETWS